MQNYNPYYNNPYIQQYNNPYQQSFQAPQQTYSLNGRTVNRLEDIQVNEIAMDGSMSFFPNVNGQEIYGKKWNADGTVSTILYRISNETTTDKEVSIKDYCEKIEGNFEDIFKQLSDIRSLVAPKRRKEVAENE